ncbi:MAG: DUF3179 domain-containing protein [Alphaproteobacteria bacterium]|nr:DUF3179 domain-containing protein [Alphaproteobacteria bacterium]
MKNYRTLALAGAIFASLTVPVMAQVEGWQYEWPNTDFTKTSVDFNSIMSGGPPKDGIPAIDDPTFISVADENRIADNEPVMTLELEGKIPRAYPIRYLTWHEIVNDVIDGRNVTITFCPLCNSALVFEGKLNGKILTFGVSGKLRNSDMIMYDRQTESWWQQAIGEGIVGDHTGDQLTQIVSWMESWGEYKARNPNALVMDEPKANRPYGSNPYAGYDSSARPFLYSGELPPFGIPPLMRVVKVGNKAWPMDRLQKVEELTEGGVTITWKSGQASALDTRQISKGKNVGTIRVRDANGKDLPHDVMFAFAFQAFYPNGDWMTGK